MRLGLRYRLLAPVLVLLVGDVAATGWAAYAAAAAAEQRIADQLRAVARVLTVPPAFGLSKPVLDQMKALSGADFLWVRADGSRAATTFADPPPAPPGDVVTAADLSDPAHGLGPPVTVAGAEFRCLRLPLTPPHPNAGGTLYVFYPEAARQAAVRDAARPLLLLGGVGGLLAVGLTAAFSRGLVRRIRLVERHTRAIADGDFRPMPVPAENDEVQDLSRAVNDTARRLADFEAALTAAERMRVLGQFSGGLAHQLRNAAAGARLAVQLHRDECPAADREPLEVTLRQLARIEATLRQFLTLGRPPTGGRRESCDLAELVGQAVETVGPQCRHAGTLLAWAPPGRLAFTGDATQLSHLFANLIGNAVEAAGPGGDVAVELRAADGRVALEVSDSGMGPPAAVADKLFDPFVTGKEQGIGLGLAVAKQAAEAHGGTLSWARRDERTVFRVDLPGPPAASTAR